MKRNSAWQEAVDAAIGDVVQLGDINLGIARVNTEGDCKEGELNVQQLRDFYAKAGSPKKWAAAVDAIMSAYDDAENSVSRHIPFTPVCGEIKAIGEQAKELVAQIAADTGTAPPPAPKVPSSDSLGSALKVGAAIAGGLVGLVLIRELARSLGGAR